MQPRAVQGMLDFDFICKRSIPSVAGIIYTFGGQFVSKMYARVFKGVENCLEALLRQTFQVLGHERNPSSCLPGNRQGHG